MNIFAQVLGWLADPAHWKGTDGIPVRLAEQLYYSALALVVGFVIAVPVGAFVGHTGRGGFLVVGIANWLRSLPDFGLLILFVLLIGIQLLPVTAALLVLAVPPLLAGTYAGISNVDRSVVDAARGMGMRERDVLLKVELPNALPLLIGGLRSAALQVIATTAIAAYVGYGGLGRYLIDGLHRHDYTQMVGGAVLVGLLALAVEGVLALLQRAVVSPGLRVDRRRARPVSEPKTDIPRRPPADRPTLEKAGVTS
ncbi:ABC transporter permease [Pseudonocardia acaciae]|uniref:ABC transporter permease n=1 Tax=Pseudonocardia acaciae TaxID=551276 RepID=UPI0006864018|nr:ABC transporter permease [Pseudonocardia acaciae]